MDKREPPYYNSEESPYVSYSFPFYETMEVLIETLTGTFFEIRVSPFESVMSVKAKIQRLEGIPITQQHLIWRNIELEDDYSLHDYHITHGCTIKLVLAMRGGPINTRKVAVEDPAVREMAEYMEENREEILDKLPANKQVTLLVFREGDQLNFFRVVERSDGTLTPLSESLSGGSMYNLYAEEEEVEELDAEESPSVEQLQENALTMSKMTMLRNHMSLAKKPKKGIPKLQPRPPSSLRPFYEFSASRSRQRLRAFPQLGQSQGHPHCLPPLCGSNAESSQQPTASLHLPGSPVTRVPSRTGPPPPTTVTTNPFAFRSPYANGTSSTEPEGDPHLSSSLLTTGVFAGGFHPAVGQVSGGQRVRTPTTDHQKATATTGHAAAILSSFSPLPAIPNGAALYSGGNFAANALTGAAFDAIVRSDGLCGATGGSLSMGADVLENKQNPIALPGYVPALEGVAVPGRGEAGPAGGAPVVLPADGTLGSTQEDLVSETHLLMHEAGGSLFNNSHVAGSYALSAADIWPAYSLFPQLEVGGVLPGMGPSAFCIPPSTEKDATTVNADTAPEHLITTEELADQMERMDISRAAVAATAARAAERRESAYKAEVAGTVEALERLMIPEEGSSLDDARLDTKWELVMGAESGGESLRSQASPGATRQPKGNRGGAGDDNLSESTKTLKRLKRSAGEPPRAAKSGTAQAAPFAGGRVPPPVSLLNPLHVLFPLCRATRLPFDGLRPPSPLGPSNLRPPAQTKRVLLPSPMDPGAFQQNFGRAGKPGRMVSAGKKVVGAHARPSSGSEGVCGAAAGAVPSCGGSSSSRRNVRLLARLSSRDRLLPHVSSVARAVTPDLLHRRGAETTMTAAAAASVSSCTGGAAAYVSSHGVTPLPGLRTDCGARLVAQTQQPKKKAATKRCFFCGRKTGLATSYECRCGNNFCGMHRYAEVHTCTFDYKSIGRRLLLDSHPAISAPKLPKI